MKIRVRRSGLWIVALAAAAVIGDSRHAVGNPPGFGASFEEVVRLANKEGKVRYGSSIRTDEAKLVLEGFEKAYPRIKVEYTPEVEQEVSGRIMAEAMTGLVDYDLVNVPSALQGNFKKSGVLAGPLAWRKIFPGAPAEHFSPDGHFAVVSFVPRVIAYNPSLVPPERVPKSWQDCLDPYWKGKFMVLTRPHPLVGLWPAWGEEKTVQFAKRLKENQPIWGRASNLESALQVAVGEVPMLCGIHYTTIFNVLRRDPQAKIAAVFPSETPIGMGETIGIMKGAKSPNAALLLAGWLASSEGQKGYEKIGRASPFIEGTETGKRLQKAGVKIIFGGWAEEEHARERTKKIVAAWGFR
ncbi:MAG TPA: extracellular solute-binding protein [Candidatus Acidoferrales bacterium]|nr:extracellular solute-binding protein [Candidatus Acidoferrales bacterium]